MINDTQISQIINNCVQKPSDDFFERLYSAEDFEKKADDTTLITIGVEMPPFLSFDPMPQVFEIPIEFKTVDKVNEKTVVAQIFGTMENYLRHEDYFKSKWNEERGIIHNDYFTPTDFDLYFKYCYKTIRNCYQETVRPILLAHYNSLKNTIENGARKHRDD